MQPSFGKIGGRAPSRAIIPLAAMTLVIGTAIAQAGDGPVASSAAAMFADNCANCHGAQLEGGGGPTLTGIAFHGKWDGKVDALGDFISKSMPPGAAQPLDTVIAKRLAAYILAQNSEKSANLGMNAPVLFTPVDDISRQFAAGLHTAAQKITPVTDAMLKKPAGDDWLVWRGSTDALGYSILKQIDRSNAGRLRLVWSKSLGPGTNGIAPLEHDGILFVHGGGQIAAFDARNGDTIWERGDSAPPRAVSQPRGMALYGDKLFTGTVDHHVMALEASTGRLIWDQVVGDQGALTAAPLVANGKLFQGAATCSAAGMRCFMVALDANSGQPLWRFDTVPGDGAPGSETWAGAPASARGGAGVWSAPSYDYENDRVIFGTGNTYAVKTILGRDPKKPAAALYTNTTLSLNAKTGKIAWYFQHFPGDVWDEDWAYERMIAKDPRSGGQVVMTMGKLGILDALDLKTGRYLWSYDYGIQNLVTATDPKTGARTIDTSRIPQDQKVTSACPYAGGVRNWPSTSYDPQKAQLFIAALDACMELKIDNSAVGGGVWDIVPREGSDNKYGRMTAIDLRSGNKVWNIPRRSPEAAAVLATAGGLVFEGTRDRWFRVLDSRTGDVLWQTRLTDTPNSFPITYAVDGKQYVAIVTGGRTYLDGMLPKLTPEIEASSGNPAIWVFALEDDDPAAPAMAAVRHKSH